MPALPVVLSVVWDDGEEISPYSQSGYANLDSYNWAPTTNQVNPIAPGPVQQSTVDYYAQFASSPTYEYPKYNVPEYLSTQRGLPALGNNPSYTSYNPTTKVYSISSTMSNMASTYSNSQRTNDINSLFATFTPNVAAGERFIPNKADLGGNIYARSREEKASGYQDLFPDLYRAYISGAINDAQLVSRATTSAVSNDRDNLGGRSPITYYGGNPMSNSYLSNYNNIFSYNYR